MNNIESKSDLDSSKLIQMSKRNLLLLKFVCKFIDVGKVDLRSFFVLILNCLIHFFSVYFLSFGALYQV